MRRAAAFADALDLALEVTAPPGADAERVTGAALRADGGMIPLPPGLARGDLRDVRASLLIVPRGRWRTASSNARSTAICSSSIRRLAGALRVRRRTPPVRRPRSATGCASATAS